MDTTPGCCCPSDIANCCTSTGTPAPFLFQTPVELQFHGPHTLLVSLLRQSLQQQCRSNPNGQMAAGGVDWLGGEPALQPGVCKRDQNGYATTYRDGGA